MSMFKRANATYEAKTKAPTSQGVPLAKQLFPSSSPTPRQDGNIKDQFQKPRLGSQASFGAASRSSPPSQSVPPLQSRLSNPSQPPRPSINRVPAGGGKPFASLYNNAENSFKEEPGLLDPIQGTAGAMNKGRRVADVEFFEDDFSDDDNLDLDYQQPAVLPPPPSLPPHRPQALPTMKNEPIRDVKAEESTSTVKEETTLYSDDFGSALSWSQSSPSHFQPARAVSISQSTTSTTSVKRPISVDEDDGSTRMPVAKKRTLPATYRKFKADIEQFAFKSEEAATPAMKPSVKEKGLQTWDITPGTYKEQQKKLKEKGKKAPPGGKDATVVDMQQAVKSHTVKQTALSLSHEQEVVKQLVCDKNKSVFFTGPAGTGKSVLMRSIIAQLKKKYAKDPERLAVTASTGLAACNIGGMTLHSFSGIGLGKDDCATLVKKIRRNPKAKNRWLRTKVLIIDEISMVDGDLFDKLSQIGRTIRNNGRPWGGIQLVITGDFFQLPPVPDYNARDAKFAFESATWETSIDHTIGLTEVFRQKDPVFANMLNEMRLGRISEETVKTFKSLSRPLEFNDGLEVTELFPTRNEVEMSNMRKLRELPGEVHRYEAFDSGNPEIRDKLLANMMAPKLLELKKGAQVMLIKNLDETLVNGSLGTVIGFSTESAFEISGGIMDDDELHGHEDVDSNVKKRLAAFSRELDKSAPASQKKWPLVQFHAVDGTSRIMLCVSEPWKVETPTGEVQASREQLPLILAWALSIHKAQGQTLARVKVDLGKVFEKGQAYVALSRATNQEGLQVLRFDKQKVMAHPRVVAFYQKLYSAESAVKKPKKVPVQASLTNFATARSRAPAKKPSNAFELDDDEEAMASYGR